MSRFTVVTILPPSKGFMFNNYLRRSINDGLDCGMVGRFVTIMGEGDTNIAAEYNNVLSMGSGMYMFAHYDVRFSMDFWNRAAAMLESGSAAVGLVGRGGEGRKILDGVMICVHSGNGIRFDEQEFDGFHLYAEDYCCKAHSIGRETRVVKCKYDHASTTMRSEGDQWGDCVKYKKKLYAKWGKIETI